MPTKAKRAKFRVGQNVRLTCGPTKGAIVRLIKIVQPLPFLWFHCSDGYLHRVTDFKRVTRREAGNGRRGR